MNLNELSNQNQLEIILVDHHYLRSKFNKIVVEIIDHHQIKKDSIILQKYVPKNLKTLSFFD
jgi:inorganic pyrophosphatase/exopolyphosphatase